LRKKNETSTTTHSIRSVVTFLALLEKLELSGEEVVFRGQTSDWPLLPDIGRLPFLSQGKAYDSWLGFEDDLLDKFRKYSYPFLPVHTRSDWDWLYIARHYGLPTRLLDWTTNPLKALFFAVQDFRADDKDSVLWALETKGWMESLERVKRDSLKDMLLVYPAHINERIVAQDACFTVFPLPTKHNEFKPANQERLVKRALKFLIPAASRSTLRIELSTLGFTQRTMFPGLDGVVASIRQYFGEGWLK
jgi:hypothetical protein